MSTAASSPEAPAKRPWPDERLEGVMTSAAALASDRPAISPSRIHSPAMPPRLSVAAVPALSAESDRTIARPRLLEQLERAGRVTMVSAPAGSGKTSLLRSWIREAGLESSAAWVPVGHGRHDPQCFWLSLLNALRRTEPGSAVIRQVTAAPDVDGWAFVENLLADLASLEDSLWLVIDDLDEVRASETVRQFELLLAHAPVQLRFVLSARRDLRLGLHRLRLDGGLTDLRGPDLRFSLEEARALFEAVAVDLPECALAVLVDRTEGWAAGLRLAAIALARHPDPERFVREFSGSERTVAGYLLEEVLEREPADVRQLLLRTSVLERVSGPLADHLVGGSGSERILQELEDDNAFVTSLDAGRSWFRYHRLFADFLQLELRRSLPAIVGSLHRAASDWFEREGYVVDAIRHAQAARDWPHAARLLLDNRIGLILDGRVATVRELLDAFPARVTADDPELAVTCASVGLRDGSFDEADAYVASAERHVEEVPQDRARLFELHLTSVRLAAASHRGDLCGARQAMHSLEAARAAQPPDAVRRAEEIHALALMTLGTTELWSLQLTDARRHLEEGLTLARRIERPYLEIGCLAHLAIVAPLSGLSASAALDVSEQAVAIAEAHGLASNPVVALAFAIGAGSLAWLGRFDEAERWLERAKRVLRPDGDPGTELALYHAQGLLYSGQGRLEDALAAFRNAEKVQALLIGEHALTVDLRMRIILTLVRSGQLTDARAALESIPEPDGDRAEVRIAAAAIDLADGSVEHALELLEPVTERSVASLIPTWAAIHALLFDAAAREQLDDARGAEASLERALDLAEPEGLILPFTIAPVQGLLERHPRQRTAHPTLRATILDVLAGTSPQPRGEAAPLVDPLSDAELRVVRYLPSNLRAPEIAAELFVSTNTVRTHLRHIYAKLDAHGRAEAVDRARQLGLLAPSHR
jgi:LuxR family transcriptional regulator, maltose regulon positive regulatory protein